MLVSVSLLVARAFVTAPIRCVAACSYAVMYREASTFRDGVNVQFIYK
jgi:hypothetical protein